MCGLSPTFSNNFDPWGGLFFGCFLHQVIQYLSWYLSIISHVVVIAAQTDEVTVFQSLVVVLIDRTNMMDFYTLIVQPVHCVIQVSKANGTKVFITLSDLYTLICPCFSLTESFALLVPLFYPAFSVRAHMPPWNYPTVFACYHVHRYHRFSVPSLFCILLRISCSADTSCNYPHEPCITQPPYHPPPKTKDQPQKRSVLSIFPC